MKAYLGLDVPNDTLGVLQDVHWSHGYVGSFPTYTIGNIMSSQFFDTAIEATGHRGRPRQRRLRPAQDWLADNIHRYGRSSLPDETLRRVTGGPLDATAYVRHLSEKVAALVG